MYSFHVRVAIDSQIPHSSDVCRDLLAAQVRERDQRIVALERDLREAQGDAADAAKWRGLEHESWDKHIECVRLDAVKRERDDLRQRLAAAERVVELAQAFARACEVRERGYANYLSRKALDILESRRDVAEQELREALAAFPARTVEGK